MGFSSEIISALNEPLPTFKREGKAGKFYEYHKGEDVIKQLNKAFGNAWSSKVISHQESHGQILVLVEISVNLSGEGMVYHQGFGAAEIAFLKGAKEDAPKKPVDIGNNYKAALTAAIKKAAEQFGVGLMDEEEKDITPVKSSQGWSPSPTSKAAPAKTEVKEVVAAVPEAVAALVDSDTPITDLQKKALANLVKMRGYSESELVQKAFEGTGKMSFAELTKMEAHKAINFINTVPKAK